MSEDDKKAGDAEWTSYNCKCGAAVMVPPSGDPRCPCCGRLPPGELQ